MSSSGARAGVAPGSGYSFGCVRYHEVQTGGGQRLTVTYDASGDVRKIDDAFAAVERVQFPATGHVSIQEGGYGELTRYAVTQLKYAGGGHAGCGGYIQVLRIDDAPDGRCGNVVYSYSEDRYGVRSYFAEWESPEAAVQAWEKVWGTLEREQIMRQSPGFIRLVACGPLKPWFLAIGRQLLVGDYVFPEGLQNDAYFQFGRKFVVLSKDGAAVKTCLGSRFPGGGSKRVVYWDDGSSWEEGSFAAPTVRPLADGDGWQLEAVRQLWEVLSGTRQQVSVSLASGATLVCKLNQRRGLPTTLAGEYLMEVQFQNAETRRGWQKFTPSEARPNLVEAVVLACREKGWEPTLVKVTRRRVDGREYRWERTYHVA